MNGEQQRLARRGDNLESIGCVATEQDAALSDDPDIIRRGTPYFEKLRDVVVVVEGQAVRQIAAPKIAKAFTQESRPAPSVEDRIERQRSDERSPRTGRSRDIDRER